MPTIKSMVPTADIAQTVHPSYVSVEGCEFMIEPSVLTVTDGRITFETAIKEDGWLYAVAVFESADGDAPTPDQIFAGNDRYNEPTHTAVANIVGQ